MCLDLRSVEAQVDDRRPAVAGDRRLAGGGVGQPAARRAARAAPPGAPALPRPVLAGGGAGRRRPAGDGVAALRPADRRCRTSNGSSQPGYEEQRGAAEIALSQRLTVLTGGPGTGKTTTVARLLALFAGQAGRASRLRIALAAPTGKAAARLQEAVQLEIDELDLVDQRRLSGLQATTLHRLLGSRPDSSSRFRHHRGNRLPHDVIVVDETSMVSLTMMARLLEAVRPQSRLLLVGDPDQLASVDAGAVLADLVDGLGAGAGSPVVALQTSHRFGESIGALASAIRDGDADAAIEVLRAGGDHIEWIDDEDPTADAAQSASAAGACAAPGGRPRRRRARRWRRSTSNGCCARTDADRTGCSTGTARSSAGSPSRRASRSGRTGTRGGRCW